MKKELFAEKNVVPRRIEVNSEKRTRKRFRKNPIFIRQEEA